MRLEWEIDGDNLFIQLVDDDEQGEIVESEIRIPRRLLASAYVAEVEREKQAAALTELAQIDADMI